MKRMTTRALALAGVLSLSLAACGSGTSGGTGGKPSVVTSFYPIEFAAQRIGAGLIEVSSLTKPGAEPHDVELGAKDLAGLLEADLVVYSKGFQPAVDDAVEQVDPSKVLEVSGAAHLDLAATQDDHAGQPTAAQAAPSGNDPHFWLDPQRYEAVAKAIGDRLAKNDPANAAAYAKNTDAFVAELETLDGEFTKGLASCRIKTLVTSHAAFGYLANRYGLRQIALLGLAPETEPTPRALASLVHTVRESGATTVLTERLASPALADTVAREAGASTAVLDPLEGLTVSELDAGRTYFDVMRGNLAVLRKALGCT